jgi:twitching motility protein PilT
MCSEVLVATPAVRAVIREGKIHQVYSLMQAGQKHGMQTMNQSLHNAVIRREITLEQALERSSEVKELQQMFDKGRPGPAKAA